MDRAYALAPWDHLG